MRDAGAWTIAQDEASRVAFGMPCVAIELGAACELAPPVEIADRLIHRVRSAKHTLRARQSVLRES